MDAPIPDTGFDLPSVGQVSFVVEHLETGMRRFDRTLGVDRYDVYHLEPPFLEESTYRGEDVDHGISIALGSAGDTSVELVEPLYGPSIHRDHLEVHGEGVHHVACFDVDEARSAVERLTEAGYPAVQTGAFAGTYYWYFDLGAAIGGLTLEIVTRDRAKPDPHAVYPDDFG